MPTAARRALTADDVDLVLPYVKADAEVETGSVDQLAELLCRAVREQAELRHARAMTLREHAGESIVAAREYVEAMLAGAGRRGTEGRSVTAAVRDGTFH